MILNDSKTADGQNKFIGDIRSFFDRLIAFFGSVKTGCNLPLLYLLCYVIVAIILTSPALMPSSNNISASLQ